MFKVTSRWNHQHYIKVEWNLGKRCNYNCSYCPKEIHDNFSNHTNIELIKHSIDTLMNIGKPIRISFTGGEPCVHPEFDEIVKYAKHKNVSWISVTTNGTRHHDFYLNLPVDQYVFSLHLEYDWRRVFSTIEILKNCSDKKIIAQIMAHHDHMDHVRYIRDRCLLESIPNTIRRIRWTEGDHDLFDDMRYHPDDLKWIKEQDATVSGNTVIDDNKIYHANDIIKLKINQYKDWFCSAGIESLMINWDGEVYRATCRVGGSLGNIYNETFVAPNENIKCTRNYCTCAADIPLTKVKSTC